MTKDFAEQLWEVLMALTPGEEAQRLASRAHDLAVALGDALAAKAAAGVVVPEALAQKALVAVVKSTGGSTAGLVNRACDLAEAMAAEQQKRFPFLFG